MVERNKIQPFVKWAGGKRQILNEIISRLPENIDELTYVEPFVGGGAVLFELKPKQAVIGDLNKELITTYLAIQEAPEQLIMELKRHENTAEYYYEIRDLDRDKEKFANLNYIEIASRFIYLNHTCFNGLYRVNKKQEFNVPFGNYKKPNIVNETGIMAVSEYLNENDVKIFCGDYQKCVSLAGDNIFVYLDPPYQPFSGKTNFTSYTANGFGPADQIALRQFCKSLHEKGVKFMESNSETLFIRELYKAFCNIDAIQAKRAINSKSDGRGNVGEFLIRNY